MNDNHHLFQSIKLTNLLSFGPDSEKIELRPLNVLIGPNASGKSNLIEAISLLKAAPHDLAEPMRRGGGSREWLWKGSEPIAQAEMKATVFDPKEENSLIHEITFSDHGGQRGVLLSNEKIAFEGQGGRQDSLLNRIYDFGWGQPAIRRSYDDKLMKVYFVYESMENPKDLTPGQSILSQVRDPRQFPQITSLFHLYKDIKLFRDWAFGRGTKPRYPQPSDSAADFLEEDASNLALVLNGLEHSEKFMSELPGWLQKFHDDFKRISVKVYGGRVELFLHEDGLSSPIPAARFSDGTLRFLCLLAILCHPTPPPLICLEEPEIGLHPDLIPTIADLLVEASQRTQLIVTTHSTMLVDALSETPDSILVCEKEKGSTIIRRLERKDLDHWLEKYSLGDLWTRGQIGGNRW